MPRVITFSVPDDDEWVVEQLKKLTTSKRGLSGTVVELLKQQLLKLGIQEAKEKMAPDWFIKDVDYSHLSVEEREHLRQFGYKGA